MNKVDKLFKEKLEAHTLQPSAQAWEKVESHLSKKNKMVVWVRVAAAIALLGALTFVALNWDSSKGTKTEIVKKDPLQTAPAPVEREEKKQVAEAPIRKKPAQKQVTKKVEDKIEDVAPVAIPEEAVAIAEVPKTEIKTETKTEKAIVLTYTLPPIKKQEPAEPVVAEAKKTGLERVLEIAKDVKNSDNALGELREAKNDIFALDFKRDKDKSKKQ